MDPGFTPAQLLNCPLPLSKSPFPIRETHTYDALHGPAPLSPPSLSAHWASLLSLALLPSGTSFQSLALFGCAYRNGLIVQPVNFWLLGSPSEMGSFVNMNTSRAPQGDTASPGPPVLSFRKYYSHHPHPTQLCSPCTVLPLSSRHPALSNTMPDRFPNVLEPANMLLLVMIFHMTHRSLTHHSRSSPRLNDINTLLSCARR